MRAEFLHVQNQMEAMLQGSEASKNDVIERMRAAAAGVRVGMLSVLNEKAYAHFQDKLSDATNDFDERLKIIRGTLEVPDLTPEQKELREMHRTSAWSVFKKYWHGIQQRYDTFLTDWSQGR